MELYPAVDLRGGRCVRLTRGDFGLEEVFAAEPVAVAESWREAGAPMIHVVDLDGALRGHQRNRQVIEELVAREIPLQVGGGIRSYEAAAQLLGLGVNRIVIGTAAVKDPGLRRRLCRDFGDRLVVGVDCRTGRLAVQGWTEQLQVTAVDFCRQLATEGVSRVVVTDIERDGMLTGPNLALVERVLSTGLRVIASGGMGRLEHFKQLNALAARQPGLEGVIVGRALYRGRFSLEEALQIMEVSE